MPHAPTLPTVSLALLALGMVWLGPGLALADSGPTSQGSVEVGHSARPVPGTPAITAGLETLTGFVVMSYWNRFIGEAPWARTTPQSVGRNFSSPWVLDDNPYYVNQMGHPFQGSVSFGAARSAGLGFWTSTVYPFAASALWELAGETERPALNDQITTTLGAIVVGEILYRTSDWIRGDGRSVWRLVASTLLSPWSTVNRTVVAGGNPEPIGPLRLSAGVGAFSAPSSGMGRSGVAPSFNLRLTHGVPGTPGWDFERPFDHFDFEFRFVPTHDPIVTLRARGLLLGREFAEAPSGDGIWGLWLSYDLAGPDWRRISTCAVGVGATGRWALGPTWTVEGTAVASAVVLGASGLTTPVGDRSYRFGPGAQAMMETFLSAGDRFRFGFDLRPFLVVSSVQPGGHDVLLEGELSARFRFWGRNAIEVTGTRVLMWEHEANGLDSRNGATQLMVSWRWLFEPLGAGVVPG